ncbi:histidine kinase [Arthrobacter crystallopoietes]|uniref:sensor histidine kinase n=1 Tax=Crystallibacter crystallopoietes TaxID=37928 RepID=UPI003D1B256E
MRPPRFPASVTPVLEALGLLLLYGLDLAVSWDFSSAPSWLDPWAVPLLGLAVYLPLLWRRRRPLLVLALSVLASIGFALLVPHTVLMLGPFVALYSVARHTRLRPAYAGLGMALVLVAANVLAQLEFVRPEEAGQLVLVSGLLGTMMTVAAFAAGRWGRSAARQRRIQAQLAAADERSRIARELHDVVAHSVSLMVLQAAGAGRLLQSDPDRARTALRHVDELGAQAISELRRMLGLLVPSDPVEAEGEAAAAAGRLGELPGLVQELRAAGREVEFAVEGQPAALPAETGTAVFRVAQEALTNAVKYADPQRPVELRLAWSDKGLGLAVRSYGSRGGSGRPAGTGHGIGGMRQRAESVGGVLEAGTTPEGGFLVSATFPAAGQATPGRPRRQHWGPRMARAAGGRS